VCLFNPPQKDYCYYEFKYVTDQRPDGIIPVVTAKEAKDVSSWNGLLEPYMKHLYIDLSCPVAELNTEKVKALAGLLKAAREDFNASGSQFHPILAITALHTITRCAGFSRGYAE